MADEISFKLDSFHSVHVDLSSQTISIQQVLDGLEAAISDWKRKHYKGLWVTVKKDQCFCLPRLIELGFEFHHAQPGYVLLNRMISDHLRNNLPAYANQYLGVAGFVVNSKNEVLVIRERHHARKSITSWKLPGGLADLGEEINETAKREVLEETGVECEFVCILAFRHMHNYRYGCSDFYHVCLMKPVTSEIKPCPDEIAECKWMDLHEYENLESISDVNRHFVQCYREAVSRGVAIGVKEVRSFDKKSLHKVYSLSALQWNPDAGTSSNHVPS